jgi:site-specific DNA-cytosine methylase
MGTGGGNVPLVMVERSTFSKKRHAKSATDFETWEPRDVTSTLNTFENSDIRATNLVVTGAPEYSIRRLTPLECCRLQGFPDGWGEIDHKESMTPEEVEFWREVRRTHAEIEGRTVKEWTEDQILRWYNGLHTDAAEYKMWGNGIALPCARYVMEGIALELEKEGGKA